MLLNEFLKEHRRVQELQKQIQALTVTMQRVRDQLQPEFVRRRQELTIFKH